MKKMVALLLFLILLLSENASFSMSFGISDAQRGNFISHIELWRACFGISGLREGEGQDLFESFLKKMSEAIDEPSRNPSKFRNKLYIEFYSREWINNLPTRHRWLFHQGFSNIFHEYRYYLENTIGINGALGVDREDMDKLVFFCEKMWKDQLNEKNMIDDRFLMLLFPSRFAKEKRVAFTELAYSIHILGDYSTYSEEEAAMLAPPVDLKKSIQKSLSVLFGRTSLDGNLSNVGSAGFFESFSSRRDSAMEILNIVMNSLPRLTREKIVDKIDKKDVHAKYIKNKQEIVKSEKGFSWSSWVLVER